MTRATQSSDEPGGIGPALVAVAVVGALLAVGAGWVAGPHSALGVAVGAGLAVGNLWLLGRTVRGFLGGGGRVPWVVIAVLKFAALFASVYFLIVSGLVGVYALAIGYGALPVGIVVAQLRAPRPIRWEG